LFSNYPPLSCSACFESIISSCDNIVVKAGFPANYGLYWVIKKAGSNNIHQKLVTTNVNGELVINKADLPAGFLIPGRIIELQVKDGADYLIPIVFVFGSKQFTCVQVSFNNYTRDEGDNSGVNVVQFSEAIIPGAPASSGNTVVYPFVNQTTFTYNHNLGRIVDASLWSLSGEEIIATIDNSNINYVIVTFTSPTTGRLLIQ
jgi:hypothetical protein